MRKINRIANLTFQRVSRFYKDLQRAVLYRTGELLKGSPRPAHWWHAWILRDPLIKSEQQGVAQVIDDLGNPLVLLTDRTLGHLAHSASLCRSPAHFVGPSNTVLTPVVGQEPSVRLPVAELLE